MAYDDTRLRGDEEGEDVLTDPRAAETEDDDDEKDPLMVGDEDVEEKDWM